MSDIDRMLQHADDLQFGRYEWTPGTPYEPETACLAFVAVEDRTKYQQCRPVFDKSANTTLDQEALSRGCMDFIYWNDHECHSADEAADFLRAAAKRL